MGEEGGRGVGGGVSDCFIGEFNRLGVGGPSPE